MDCLVHQYKREQIRLQVQSEAEERKNQQFVDDIAKWLRATAVDPETLNVVVSNIRLQFSALSDARRTIKKLMDENLRLALQSRS